MKKTLLVSILALSCWNGFSQSKLWNKTSEEKVAVLSKFERMSNPDKFELFSVNFSELKNALSTAPLDTSGITSNTVVSFPDYTGKISNYVIYEAPVMEKGLSDKYPDIKSYVGKGIEDKTATIRFSTSLFGLHVMMTSGEAGTYYIDTYTKDLNNYIVYSRKDIKNTRTFSCMVEDSPEEVASEINTGLLKATDGKFRQYRLAMACTIEYAAYHVNASPQTETTDAEKKATVLAAMNTTMTRVNGIYEKDMSLRMNLIANNDAIIFISTDNFSNSTATSLINESQTEIDAAIGSANYDIGHTVSTGGGGLAQLNSPCSSSKARGITGSPAPVGDPYDVDYVAHEMGHQFGGPHTFSGTGGSCTGNASAADAVEPGSGTTIMAYAGICTNNVQSNSDPYFHAVSIAKMTAFMTGAGNCATQAANSNTPPVIASLTNYTIPNGTPFVLTGSATDANPSAALTYCWEQTNAANGIDIPSPTQTSGPNFRSLNPTTSPSRSFPNAQSVLSGQPSTWEVLPTVARTMNFALVVRDNQTPTGGQTARANMTVTTVAGTPFAITSPNVENTSWNQGSTQTITWNVGPTNAAPINTTNVNIMLSTDGGTTYSTLVANTANDGTETITVPNIAAPYCRIKIEPVGNIYYTVSKSLSIGYTVVTQTICTDYTRTVFANPNLQTSWAAFNLPAPPGVTDSYTITDANVTVVANAARTNQVSFGLVKPGSSVVDFVLFDGPTSGCGNAVANLNVKFDDEGAAFACGNANSGQSYKPLTSLTGVDGMNSAGQWLLAAKSTVAGNTISSITLNLCRTETTITLNSESFGLQNFSIYPNPNNGNFTVQFDSQSSNTIKVGVHDLRGRLVFEKDYQNTGAFNQNLQLNNVQSGIYMVTVQDGDKKEVKKIVIN
ncbi:M12 family metallo-peptidase [Flavobacterium sp. SM15]|uniref:zinc-dependent metalloprotease n=1 Tax=Flavobacterium sp. SM15 TaxID=2908005 RepID=UPI001EDB6626|nr:zinc-dependent metalloprotease family protein [Flavobacterium sp. SM15]MCG2612170.1 M12 family metallo-peptidase [Flavobacterium sp. SM15]